MILPKTDITIMGIRNVLGYPSTDLGTLCSCNKVNMWSRFKPLDNGFDFNRPSNWYEGRNGDFGINVKTHSTITTLMSDVVNGVTQYTWLKPTGGSGSPYRQGDFAGYNSDALPPIHDVGMVEEIYLDSGSFAVTPMRHLASSTEISEDELYSRHLSGARYFGIAFKRESDGNVFWLTSSSGNDLSVTVPIDTAIFRSGTNYKAVQFISGRKKTSFSGSVEGSGSFIILPNAKVHTVRFLERGERWRIYMRINPYENNTISGKVVCVNNSADSQYVRNVHIRVTHGDGQGGAIIQIGDINIPGNTTSMERSFSQVVNLPYFNSKGGKATLFADYNEQQTQMLMKPLTPR